MNFQFYKILMKKTAPIILFPQKFDPTLLETQKPTPRSSRKKRPFGGRSSNHLTVIIAEHHINLSPHGEVTHWIKDNKKCCDVEDFFLPFAQHAAPNDMLRFTAIFHRTYVFCFHFFLRLAATFNSCGVACRRKMWCEMQSRRSGKLNSLWEFCGVFCWMKTEELREIYFESSRVFSSESIG